MTPPGLVLVATKSSRADAADEWRSWYPGFVASLVGGPIVAASTWTLHGGRDSAGPGAGHTHVTRIDVDGSVAAALGALDDALRAGRADGSVHPCHAEIRRDAWVAHGRAMGSIRAPGALITAEVMSADPRREPEWDRWYDTVHLPDMLATGAFAAGSRWVRSPRRGVGADHLSLYEIDGTDVDEAIRRSAAAISALALAGRRHDCHTGGLTMALRSMASE